MLSIVRKGIMVKVGGKPRTENMRGEFINVVVSLLVCPIADASIASMALKSGTVQDMPPDRAGLTTVSFVPWYGASRRMGHPRPDPNFFCIIKVV